MVYSDYVKQRMAKPGVYKFVRRYEETATIWRRPGGELAKKLIAEAKRIVDEYGRSTVRAYGRSTFPFLSNIP